MGPDQGSRYDPPLYLARLDYPARPDRVKPSSLALVPAVTDEGGGEQRQAACVPFGDFEQGQQLEAGSRPDKAPFQLRAIGPVGQYDQPLDGDDKAEQKRCLRPVADPGCDPPCDARYTADDEQTDDHP